METKSIENKSMENKSIENKSIENKSIENKSIENNENINNDLEQVHEKILNDVGNAYDDEDNGLQTIVETLCHWGEEARDENERDVSMGRRKLIRRPIYDRKDLGLTHIRKPRKRISVLIIGNHSAGKSSFINWYIDEIVQKESVAMETSGFTFVTSGKKRASFIADLTVSHMRFIEGIYEFEGIEQNLSTEISTSTNRRFSQVDFIDTPGLTDGQLEYPFDINSIIPWLAQRVNLVFIFFDPHGQATCARTMEIIRTLNNVCKDQKKQKIHYFLTKADECHSEKERQKVMTQLSQSLSRCVQDTATFYGEHALEVRIMYRPTPNQEHHHINDYNQIDEACQLIDKAIDLNVQTHIKQLEKHTKEVLDKVNEQLVIDHNNIIQNERFATLKSAFFGIYRCIILILIFYLLHVFSAFLPTVILESIWVRPWFDIIRFLSSLLLMDRKSYRYYGLLVILIAVVCMALITKLLDYMMKPQRPPSEKRKLMKWRQHLREMMDRNGFINSLWDYYASEATNES